MPRSRGALGWHSSTRVGIFASERIGKDFLPVGLLRGVRFSPVDCVSKKGEGEGGGDGGENEEN